MTTATATTAQSATPPTEPQTGLVAEGITVRFGGLVAVDELSLHAPHGTITGLIGPNGAGKTTTFNALTGVIPYGGSVRLGSTALDGLTTRQRAQAGLGRTFQRMELCDTMTVQENVALGPDLASGGRRVWRQLIASASERRATTERTADAISRCRIESLSPRLTGELSTGQRRMVELARAIATGFPMLLLDEPSSGLDPHETEHFGSVIVELAESGIGILLVEHDMTLVRTICSTIYVLDFGKLLIHGPAAEVLGSTTLRAAYLGNEVEA